MIPYPYDLNYTDLPAQHRGGIRRWIEEGRLPGGFLAAVLSNDLTESVQRADSDSLRVIREICHWLYNNAPGPCWGSPGAVKAWPAQAKQNQKRAADAMRDAVKREAR